MTSLFFHMELRFQKFNILIKCFHILFENLLSHFLHPFTKIIHGKFMSRSKSAPMSHLRESLILSYLKGLWQEILRAFLRPNKLYYFQCRSLTEKLHFTGSEHFAQRFYFQVFCRLHGWKDGRREKPVLSDSHFPYAAMFVFWNQIYKNSRYSYLHVSVLVCCYNKYFLPFIFSFYKSSFFAVLLS